MHVIGDRRYRLLKQPQSVEPVSFSRERDSQATKLGEPSQVKVSKVKVSHSMRHKINLVTRDAHALVKGVATGTRFHRLAPELNLPNRCLRLSPKQINSTFNSRPQTVTVAREIANSANNDNCNNDDHLVTMI